jgi:hypothetical protein
MLPLPPFRPSLVRLAAAASLALAAATRAAEPAIGIEELPPPALADAPPAPGTARLAGTLAVSPEGVAWLLWIDAENESSRALRLAIFDAAARRWRPAQTLHRGPDLHASHADPPALTVGPGGRATVLFHLRNAPSPDTAHLDHGPGYRAVLISTGDGGTTWTAPTRLSGESELNEFAALTTLADGRVLAVWLDGRVKKIMGAHPDHKSGAHGAMKLSQVLYSRIVAPASAVRPDAPDTVIEVSVCDCCHTALTAFPDGTALLAYRGRSEDETRDIRVTRFRGQTWEPPRTLNSDDWRIAACPVNGPQLASDGGRVGVAWFTAEANDPRVLASFSPDAGTRFLMPLRLTEGKPAGRVSTVLLHDGALLVSWVDEHGALLLRRLSPDYSPDAPIRLTRPEDGRIKGFPRLALLRDYTGGKAAAQLLVTFTREGPPAALGTLLVTVPEGELLAAGKDCDCTPTPEQLLGFPLRGAIVGVDAGTRTVRVRHPEVPGMFAAGTTEFVVSDALAASLAAGREFLGRFERTAAGWRLFDVRLIASPPR